ncbi:MAG: glycosyltransferase, partial [Candidatus Tectomicrobia bacterium]
MSQVHHRSRLRVLHVIPAVAARYGGPSRAILETCRALEGQDIESLIATTDADGPVRLPVALGRPITYQGVPTIFFARQWSEGFKYSHPLACWLQTNVRRFDLVHIDAVFSHASLAAARACQRHRIPYVVRPLGSLAPWCVNQKRFRKRLLWHFGVKQMLCRAAAIHYTTAEERRRVERRSGLRCGIVVPLGIDEGVLNTPRTSERFRQQYAGLGQAPYVLVLSRLHPVKGLELFFDAFLDVGCQEAFRHWRLVVAGDGEGGYVRNLKCLVQERGGDGRVLFTGWLDEPEKVAALQGAALLALPSHHENFGLSAAEALACGVPVLVSTQVNLADEIRRAGAGWVVNLRRLDIRRALEEALRHEA